MFWNWNIALEVGSTTSKTYLWCFTHDVMACVKTYFCDGSWRPSWIYVNWAQEDVSQTPKNTVQMTRCGYILLYWMNIINKHCVKGNLLVNYSTLTFHIFDKITKILVEALKLINNTRNGFCSPKNPILVVLHIILWQVDPKLTFLMSTGGHIGFMQMHSTLALVYWSRPAKGCYTSQKCSCSYLTYLGHIRPGTSLSVLLWVHVCMFLGITDILTHNTNF